MTSRSCAVSITYGELCVDIEAEGVYSPDGVHDLIGQCLRGFSDALAQVHLYEVPDSDDDSDDE